MTIDTHTAQNANHPVRTIRTVRALCALIAFMIFAFPAVPADAAEDRPFLRLDTGGHMALIRDMLFTRDGKRLISASDDKTIRIWDIEKKRTVKILRGEIDAGDGGKIYQIALSPDGRHLAAAGHTGIAGAKRHPVRLYDLASGEIVKLFSGHREPVLAVAFSPDGRRLATAGMDDTAIVWDLASGRQLSRVRHPSGDINTVRFTRNGRRLVTGGDDSIVRLWRARDGELLANMKGHEKLIRDIAISPQENLIATSATDGRILLWDPGNGNLLRRMPQLETGIPRIRFSPDGRLLLSGIGGAPHKARIWDLATGTIEIAYGGHDNIIMATAFSPDGQIAATAGGNNNEIHLWTVKNPRLIAKLKGIGRSVLAAAVSDDARHVAWGHTGQFANPNDQGPLQFTLRLPAPGRSLGEPRKIDDKAGSFGRLPIQSGNLSLSHASRGPFGYWDTIDISRNGQRAASASRGEKDGYTHNAYGFLPGGRAIISGAGHGWISAYGLNGRKLRDYIGHSGDVWAIAASKNGKLLVSGSDDQTLRLWNLQTGENIISLFHAANGEWVMWTPQGYFNASPDGDRHIGWHVNQGPAKAARLVTAAQLKRHFYRPDIVRRALELTSARAALAEAPGITFALDQLLNRKPPVVNLLSPADASETDAETANVRLNIGSNLDPVQTFELTVNGRRINLGKISVSDGKAFDAVIPAPLDNGRNAIEITTSNAVGKTVTRLTVTHTGDDITKPRGVLYLIAIGVDDYTFFEQDLRFAGADASAFSKAVTTSAGALHSRIEAVSLVKGGKLAPTAANIRKVLSIFEKARPEDTVVLFLAGHGVNDGADYLFLPSDAKFDKKAKRWQKASVIDWRQLHGAIENAQGRRIMVVDTCKAGNAYNPRLIKDADDANVAVLAATDAETLAQERPGLGHGVFTYSILKGLGGEADLEPDRLIKVRELATFITQSVKTLTKGSQEPTARLPRKANFVFSKL